jgi:hypothetical protein
MIGSPRGNPSRHREVAGAHLWRSPATREALGRMRRLQGSRGWSRIDGWFPKSSGSSTSRSTGRGKGGSLRRSCQGRRAGLGRFGKKNHEATKMRSRGGRSGWQGSSHAHSTRSWNPFSFVAQVEARVLEFRE